MVRRPSAIVPAIVAAIVAAIVVAACAQDATAPSDPTPARLPDAPSSYVALFGYQATVLPLDRGAAINSAGAVVGTLAGQGAYYAQGVTTTLALLPTVTSVTPVALLDDGRILAQGNGPQGPKALYYPAPHGSPIDIAAPGWAEPTAMNNAGIAVGRYGPHSGGWGGFRWSAATGLVDITPPGYDLAWATNISRGGYVIGWVQLGNTVSNFRWNLSGTGGVVLPHGLVMTQPLDDGSVLVRLPTLGSAIWAPWGTRPVGPDPSRLFVDKISPNGRYVGFFVYSTDTYRAWTSIGGGAPITLPVPTGFTSVSVRDVNGCGTILGQGVMATGERHAILWTRALTCDSGPILSTR